MQHYYSELHLAPYLFNFLYIFFYYISTEGIGNISHTEARCSHSISREPAYPSKLSSSLTHPEVVDPLVGNLGLDPVQGCIVSGAVLLLHEVGEVSHAGKLVQVGRGQVLGLQDQRDVEMLLGHLHRALAILQPRNNKS